MKRVLLACFVIIAFLLGTQLGSLVGSAGSDEQVRPQIAGVFLTTTEYAGEPWPMLWVVSPEGNVCAGRLGAYGGYEVLPSGITYMGNIWNAIDPTSLENMKPH